MLPGWALIRGDMVLREARNEGIDMSWNNTHDFIG
jgi:hypothetical protein